MPNKLPNPPYKLEDRGYKTPCWIWLGCQRKGYGQVSNPNYNGTGGKMMSAHVWMYEKMRGPVLNRSRKFVPDHLCRVRLCVNPDHIEWKSNRENVWEGDLPKLTRQEADQIRLLLSQELYSQGEIASIFNISQSTVSCIKLKGYWQ
jgi:predicted DNA-binding protein (UPF0251 family)